MALKKSHGNMYDWVTHMHTHLAGECPHGCGYCYVQTNPRGVSPRWKGEPRLIEEELRVDYSKKWWDEKDKIWKIEKTIFIEHMGDLFAEGIDPHWVDLILAHCNKYPDNTYIFQTKDPGRAHFGIKVFPPKFMIGTTLETNRDYKDTNAPQPMYRYIGISKFIGVKTFVTIEPIMDFDMYPFLNWIKNINPDFVNIGADSKRCNLPEPSPAKIIEFISGLKASGVHIKKKSNLDRLLKVGSEAWT